MKFLIQKIDGKIKHDFSFTLIQSADYYNWLAKGSIKTRFTENDLKKDYTPIGSIDFVHAYMDKFLGKTPKPINVPDELLDRQYTQRTIINGSGLDISGEVFIKSNDRLKATTRLINTLKNDISQEIDINGNYQISEVIDIQSEYRCFVFQNKLVGIHYYSGNFRIYPNITAIENMISVYKSAPVAYTLDVGVNDNGTFVIECHNFYSCGLYGFNNLKLLPLMFNWWFYEFKRNNLK